MCSDRGSYPIATSAPQVPSLPCCYYSQGLGSSLVAFTYALPIENLLVLTVFRVWLHLKYGVFFTSQTLACLLDEDTSVGLLIEVRNYRSAFIIPWTPSVQVALSSSLYHWHTLEVAKSPWHLNRCINDLCCQRRLLAPSAKDNIDIACATQVQHETSSQDALRPGVVPATQLCQLTLDHRSPGWKVPYPQDACPWQAYSQKGCAILLTDNR